MRYSSKEKHQVQLKSMGINYSGNYNRPAGSKFYRIQKQDQRAHVDISLWL